MSYKCPYCVNGTIPAGWNYLAHMCTDCSGTGYIQEEGIDFWVCEECGEAFPYELDEGICEGCQEKLEEEKEKNE